MANLVIILAIHLCQAAQTDSQCLVNCQSCSRQKTCYRCKPGYFNDTRRIGECTQCPKGCTNCSSWHDCVSCESGYYLLNGWCFSCSKYSHAWQCSKGCVNGFYGQFCNVSCSEGCHGKECNRQSGRCVNGCLDGYHGEMCQRCSEWCLNRVCEEFDGRCTKGCVDGYYEYEKRCDKCPDGCYKTSNAVSSCFQANGTCLYGCVSGFTGHNCTKEIPTIQQRPMVLAITGSALGVVLIVAVAVALILLVRNRRNKVTKSPVCEDSNSQHVRRTIRNPTYDASIGNPAGSEVKPDSDDHEYAVVHKAQLKQNRVNGIDQSEDGGNVYDVTSTERQAATTQWHSRMEAVKTGDDTYSHISHVSEMGRFINEHQMDCETVYDLVSQDVGLPCNEGTYNVIGSIHSQSCGRRTERMRTNSLNLVDVMQDEDGTYSHTNQQFVTSNTDHATYNTTCDVMLPQSMKDD